MRTWVRVCIVFFCVVTILVIVLLPEQDKIAKAVWQKYRLSIVALMLARTDADLAMEIGSYYFGGGAYDLSRADAAYQKALQLRPGMLWSHYQLARIKFVEGNFDAALKEINAELLANPENLRSLYVRGLIYAYSDRLELAAADFRRFIEWAPSEWGGYNDLAWVLSKQSKFKEARDLILDSRGQIPDGETNPWLWNALGVAELNLKNYASAKISFGKAKEYAALLTEKDWRASYSGNDAQYDSHGLREFKEAIEKNVKQAAENMKNSE